MYHTSGAPVGRSWLICRSTAVTSDTIHLRNKLIVLRVEARYQYKLPSTIREHLHHISAQSRSRMLSTPRRPVTAPSLQSPVESHRFRRLILVCILVLRMTVRSTKQSSATVHTYAGMNCRHKHSCSQQRHRKESQTHLLALFRNC
jgi:hypothetical protein